MQVLKWARCNGCDWDEYTCTNAVAAQRLDILQWARSQDCPWDHRTFRLIEEEAPPDIELWARKNGLPQRLENGGCEGQYFFLIFMRMYVRPDCIIYIASY